MKIGLIRHFQVMQPYPQKKLVNTRELLDWFKDYEKAQIEKADFDLLRVDWRRCYSSDLHRAFQTARHIYPGKVIKREELREIPVTKFKKNLYLPFIIWAILVRVSWITNKEKKIEIKNIRKGLNILIEEILTQNEDTLIVSHGALMIIIEKELRLRGFSGPSLGNPQNGKLYIFDNGK